MKKLIKKYEQKLVKQNLTEKGSPLFGALGAEIIWNKKSNHIPLLNKVITKLGINSLLFSQPKEPYLSILNFLTSNSPKFIKPQDCETLTFLHDLPVIDSLNEKQIVKALKQRKSVIIKNKGIITPGYFSPEQAFVFFSSVCFATFVKFFTDYLTNKHNNNITPLQKKVFHKAIEKVIHPPKTLPDLKKGILKKPQEIRDAMIEAGKATVNYGLVDSYFGNISYYHKNKLYISETASSLDELNDVIDCCPLDGSRCSSLTASSEFSAHKSIVQNSETKAILHGHPKFSVIMSMICNKKNCQNKGECNTKCSQKRFIKDTQIVPGEVGTGKYGLSKTVPKILKTDEAAIVYGHGVFTTGKKNYNHPFKTLLELENKCFEYYLNLI